MTKKKYFKKEILHNLISLTVQRTKFLYLKEKIE